MAAEHEEMEKEIYKRFAEKDYETPEGWSLFRDL